MASASLGKGVRSRLRAARQDLLPAEARVADLLLERADDAVRLPVAQLAASAAASQATVVRLAQRLGYRGFTELRIALAHDEGADRARTVFEEVDRSDSLTQVADKVAAATIASITDTRRLLEPSALEAVVGALATARRVEAYGVSASGMVALDAAAKLRRLGLAAWSYPDAHQQVASASLLRPGDVALVFSHSGATRDAVDAASIAKAAGATVVGITSIPLSPLARSVDHLLLTGVSEPTERSGSTAARVAQLYVVDVLTVGLALSRYEASQAALARTAAAVNDRKIKSTSSRQRGGRS